MNTFVNGVQDGGSASDMAGDWVGIRPVTGGGGGVKVRLPRNLHRFLFFISHKSIAGLPKRNMDLGRVGLLYWWHLALDREEGGANGGANDGRPMADCNVQTTFFNYICKESIALFANISMYCEILASSDIYIECL